MKKETSLLEKLAVPNAGNKRMGFHNLTSLMKVCETSNEFLVVTYLHENGPATRGDIVRDTPVKWTTAHDSLIRLQIKGIVKREVVTRGRGRPSIFWSLKD
ncbi:MAG: hypothetical protein ACFFD4_07225 [Candidatus Odinarchaeota archaeon]